jgi:septal ring factor EnvC (AmiA/AmiB activator)
MILFGMINSNQSQSYTPSTTTSSSYASPAGQNADSSTSDTTSGNATSSSQSTSETSELSDLRKRIEAGRTRMTALETQLQPVSDELDSLTARIKPLEAEIKALDQQHAEGMEIDRDRRNSLYNEYEPLFKRRRALFEANSSDFKVLDDLGKADKEMMEQWKALGGKVN